MTEVVELYVVMHCEACEASVRRAIRNIPGLESYKIDFYDQKVTVIGKVDRDDVWRRIHKTGKRVTLIPKPVPLKKEEKKEEKKEGKKEGNKDKEEKEEKKEEKKEGKTQKKKVKTRLVRKKSTYWPAIWLWRFFVPQEAKVHQKRDEVVTVLEVKESKKEESKVEEKTEGKEETQKKETSEEPEWVPMYVSAPFYTLSTQWT